MKTRVIDFSGSFEPVQLTCRAPLPSGSLCPRQDRYTVRAIPFVKVACKTGLTIFVVSVPWEDYTS